MRSSFRIKRDERGMMLVFVGLSLMALLSVTALAIDIGMLMTARSQAQNAADAGALAGAVALVFDDYADRSTSGPAVQSAVGAALANSVMNSPVSVTPSDVQFLNDAAGQPNRVQITVRRTASRGNPVSNLIASYFGQTSTDITATAAAEASLANAADCVLPFAVPDKWIERQTPPWDTGDTFMAFPTNPSLQPDIYRAADSGAYTGYSPWTDLGLRITIKAATGNSINPSIYFPISLPGSSGASDYEWNIANCNTSRMHIFDLLTAEPGNMVGPTKAGVEDLIAQDPDAYWDWANHRVISSINPSPRVRLMPVFDPLYYDIGKHEGRTADFKAANFVGVFIEGMQGNDVVARIVPATGLLEGSSGPAPPGTFPRAISLVQ